MLIVGLGLLLMQAVSQAIKYLAIFKGYTQVSQSLQEDTDHLPLE
jgi:TRAP-type mannitol/chloroaromatic compound transport system permease small subunit